MLGARTGSWKIAWILCFAWMLAGVGQVEAAPLNLLDATARRVEVRFEISPQEAPGQLDETWGSARQAYLEPDPSEQTVRIRIPAAEVEAQLRSTGADPVEGTFSDFIWTFDALSGHVLRAELSGRVRQTFGLGVFRSSGEIEIRVEMTTHVAAGFRPANVILGQSTHAFCAGNRQNEDCTIVEPMRFDPKRGYVNAVGSLRAITPFARIQTFSPLGEVVFSEWGPDSQESVASGRSSHDAVCSGPMNGSCRPDLRGESS